MTFARIAWSLTVLACFVTAILLFVKGFDGYGGVCIAVGLAAAINIFTKEPKL